MVLAQRVRMGETVSGKVKKWGVKLVCYVCGYRFTVTREGVVSVWDETPEEIRKAEQWCECPCCTASFEWDAGKWRPFDAFRDKFIEPSELPKYRRVQ